MRFWRFYHIFISLPSFILLWSIVIFWLFIPHAIFFNYHAVVPTRTVIGEPLVFESRREIFLSVPLQYEDSLFCEELDGMFKHRRQYDTGSKPSVTAGLTLARWDFEYTAVAPERCYLRSVIKFCPIGKLCADQTIIGEIFEIERE